MQKLLLTDDQVLVYALKNHANVNYISKDEFIKDYKKFKTVVRHINKYDVLPSKYELLKNHIILLSNLFTPSVTQEILAFFLRDESKLKIITDIITNGIF